MLLVQPASHTSCPTAACASRSAAPRVTPCFSPHVAPCCSQRVEAYCSQRVALCCHACRALLQPARRALLQPMHRALLPCASRPAAASVAPYYSQRVAPYYSQRVALCCPTRRALLQPARRALLPHTSRPAALHSARPAALRPAATTAAAARATASASEGAAGTAGSAGSAAGAGGATGSAGGAAGAGGATGSAGGAAGAGAARGGQRRSLPLPDDPTPQQLRESQSQQETFSPQVISELFPQRCITGSVKATALGASESAATLGASESAVALGASEPAAALGARASPTTGPSSAEALHTFTLDSAVSSGSLSGLHLPTFSTNLVRNAAIQDVWVGTFIPRGQRVAICQVAASRQVSASGQLAASCSCRVLSHQTLLWHHRLGHPSLPRLRGMHSRLLVSGLPRSLPSLPRSLAPPCLPCVEGRQRAAPHSSEFPPTTAPLQTLHMDVWGPALVGGMDQKRYFLLVVDDYTRYTTVFPLWCKADVSGVLIPWIRATRRQLRERFSRDFPVLRLHSDRGGEFSSDLLAEFCQDEGIVQSFTLPASP
ncbi:unnamed protein product [Closterium sp. NIES-54]